MRGFSTIEIVITLAIVAASVVAGALITFGTPTVLENARLERSAYGIASALLTGAELDARGDFDQIAPVASTSDGIYERSLMVDYVYEGLAARLKAHVSWTDAYGTPKEILLESVVTDPEAALDEPCSPLVSENWRDPRVLATYRLSSDDLLPGTVGTYPVSGLRTTRGSILISVDSTGLPANPTLFLFSLGTDSERPRLIAAFDNASTSRVGYVAITTGGGYAYAANGFGSASQTTCEAGSCAQLSVFDYKNGLDLVSRLTLSTSAPPYAISAGNSTTPGKSIAYRKGLVYLGLEKTVDGSEFNIIDVHNPAEPRWIGGVAIGRSVNGIGVQGGYAYLATSDSSRELVVVDIRDPHQPHVVGSWNAPGSTNFGLGSVSVARLARLYFGRTYVGNAPEFFMLDTSAPEHPIPTHEHDPGTVLRPESIRGIVTRDFLTVLLSGKRLELWDGGDSVFGEYADSIDLPGVGTSLACRNNTLYVGATAANGTGMLVLVSSS